MAKKQTEGVDQRIARRIRARRSELELSLEELAARSQVSRSMLSRIERAESSATASLLLRVCDALGLTLSGVMSDSNDAWHVVARRHEQLEWRDPGSGYVRRMISPPVPGSSFEIVEIELPAGAVIDFSAPTRVKYDRQIFVLSGKVHVTLEGGETLQLAAGDCAYTPQLPVRYENAAARTTRYLVVHTSTLA